MALSGEIDGIWWQAGDTVHSCYNKTLWDQYNYFVIQKNLVIPGPWDHENYVVIQWKVNMKRSDKAGL